MKKKWAVCAVVFWALPVSRSQLSEEPNPSGWIKTVGWNMLFPLTNPYGCDGGGSGKMLENWVTPHDLRTEHPDAMDRPDWSDIDFGDTAVSTGFELRDVLTISGLPPVTWLSLDSMTAFLGLEPPDFETLNRDAVDFRAIIDLLNTKVVSQPPVNGFPVCAEKVLGIAQTYVENQTGAPLCLDVCTRSDDSVQVWVNEELVLNKSICRAVDQDCSERSPALFEPGLNKITVLVWQGTGTWGFGLALMDGAKKLSSSNQELLLFHGTDQQGLIVPSALALSRSAANPDACPVGNPTRVTIRGNGKGSGRVVVREKYSLSDIADLSRFSNISDGGTVTYDAGTGEYTIRWSVPESVLNSTGVRYDVRIDGGKSAFPFGDFEIAAGFHCSPILGEAEIRGSLAHTGPIGLFEDSHDIGAAADLAEGAGSLTVQPGPDGQTGTSDDLYTIRGSGKDIWDLGDSFHFAYRRVQGDFSATVRIASRIFPATGGRWGRYGMMARLDCSPNSKYSLVHADLEADPGPGADHLRGDAVYYQFRHNHRVNPSNDNSQYVVFPDPDGGGPLIVNQPNYFRLERRGNLFTGYASFDKVIWKLVGSDLWHNLDPQDELLVGFAYSKHGTAPQPGRITFTDFEIGPPPEAERFDNDLNNPEQIFYQADFNAIPDGGIPPDLQFNCRSNCDPPGGFTPRIVNHRLRLTQEEVYGNATSVFIVKNPPLPAGTGKIIVEYTVYMHLPSRSRPPADGMTMTIIAKKDGRRVGNSGPGLGYGWLVQGNYDDAAPSFSVECDTWNLDGWNEGAGSPSAPGRWHLAINVSGNTNSIAMRDFDLPDIFGPQGVRLRVELMSEGKIEVFIVTPGGGGGANRLVLVGTGPSLGSQGDIEAEVGFTASTGGESSTIEIDDIIGRKQICSDSPEVANIVRSPDGPVEPGATVKLDGSSSIAGGGETKNSLTYEWTALEPNTVEIFEPTKAITDALVLIQQRGQVRIKLTVTDGDCVATESGETTDTIDVQPLSTAKWITYDLNGDGLMDISDSVYHINFMFLGGSPPKCREAADFDFNGAFEISDPVAALNYLFLAGKPPPKGLSCQSYPTCSQGCGCGGLCGN